MKKLLLFFAVSFLISPAVPAAIVDSINPNADTPVTTVSGTEVSQQYGSIPGGNIGWYYTPGISFQLTRIETKFDPRNSSNPPSVPTTPITISVYSDRPVLGGNLLTTATFDAGFWEEGFQGTDLPPIDILSGTKYFVAFSGLDPGNDNAIGVNYGYWQIQNGQNVLAGGATTDLGAHYFGTGFSTEALNGFYVSSEPPLVRQARNSPIIRFHGVIAVPEPASTVALLTAVAVVGIRRFRVRATTMVP